MVELGIILQVLQTVSIIIGVFYYIMTLQNSNKTQQLALKAQEHATKTRQTEILFQRLQRTAQNYEAWGEVMFVQEWNSLDEMIEKYSWSKEPKARANFSYVLNLYNNVGLLLQEKIADPELLFKVFDPVSLLTTWSKFEPIILEMRKQTNYEAQGEGFEYLANEARKRFPEINLIRRAKIG